MEIYCVDDKNIILNPYDFEQLKHLEIKKEYEFTVSRYKDPVLQLVIYEHFPVKGLKISTNKLIGADHEIKDAVKCINFVDNPSKGYINLYPNMLSIVFVGISLKKTKIGKYETKIKVGDEEISIVFHLTDELVKDKIAEVSPASKLKWLNSNVGNEEKVYPPFRKIEVDEDNIVLTGKTLKLSPDGLLDNVFSYYSESIAIEKNVQKNLFFHPMYCEIDKEKIDFKIDKYEAKLTHVDVKATGHQSSCLFNLTSKINFDSTIKYKVKITSLVDKVIHDFKIKMFFESASFFMGIGLEGQKIGDDFQLFKKWDPNLDQRTFFIGDLSCGACFKIIEPLLCDNLHAEYNKKELNWQNFANGGVSISHVDAGKIVEITTGPLVLAKNEERILEFELILTPLKNLHSAQIFDENIGEISIYKDFVVAVNENKKAGMNYIMTPQNIRYYKANNPLYSLEGLKALSNLADDEGLTLGLEYNLRHLSSNDDSFHLFNLLGDELLLEDKMNASTQEAYGKLKDLDFSRDDEQFVFINPKSRYSNYYLKNMSILLSEANISCVSMVDPLITAATAKKLKRILSKSRQGKGIFELILNDRFNEQKGFATASCNYAHVIAAVDKIFFNKKIDYTKDIYYHLLEQTGLIFGISSNFRSATPLAFSLLFAGTTRFGLKSLSSQMIKNFNNLVDKYGFKNSSFCGFWDPNNPIRVDKPNVLASCYRTESEKFLISVFNYNPKQMSFEVGVETKYGVSFKGKKTFAPFLGIEQAGSKVNFEKVWKLPPYSGIVVLVM